MTWLGGCGHGGSNRHAALSSELAYEAAWRPFSPAPGVQVGATGHPYAVRPLDHGRASPALPFDGRPSSQPPKRQNGLAASKIVSARHPLPLLFLRAARLVHQRSKRGQSSPFPLRYFNRRPLFSKRGAFGQHEAPTRHPRRGRSLPTAASLRPWPRRSAAPGAP